MREPVVRLEMGELLLTNGKKVGDVICDVDGYYKFFPGPHKGGYWPPYLLRDIADLLDAKNKEWDDIINGDTLLGG